MEYNCFTNLIDHQFQLRKRKGEEEFEGDKRNYVISLEAIIFLYIINIIYDNISYKK